MKTILKVDHIEKYYGNKGNITRAVDDISFDVNEGGIHRYYGSIRKWKNDIA